MDEDKPEAYDPAKAATEELEKKKKEQERKEFEEDIHQINCEAAQDEPPSIVLAYKKVYGKLPKGWPPV